MGLPDPYWWSFSNLWGLGWRISNRILKRGWWSLLSSLRFPKVPQSSRPESLGFPSYPLPLQEEPYKYRRPHNACQITLSLWMPRWHRGTGTHPKNTVLHIVSEGKGIKFRFQCSKFWQYDKIWLIVENRFKTSPPIKKKIVVEGGRWM